MQHEPTRIRGASGFDWTHEVKVALPLTYHQADRSYPVLWLTDGSLSFDLAVGMLSLLMATGECPEMIIVGVGVPRDTDMMELNKRRTIDFFPEDSPAFFDGLGGDLLAAFYPLPPEFTGGKAGRFLDFLVDDLRAELSADYRMKADDHALFGISAGGLFVGQAIFVRPGAFARYICGSPALMFGNGRVFELERAYAETHDDLPAQIFFGAGEAESDDFAMSTCGIVESMVRLSRTLHLRRYPSLKLHTRIFPHQTHGSVMPLLIGDGIRTLWADEIAARPTQADELAVA